LSATASSAYIYTQPVLVIAFAFLFAVLGISDDYTNTITWDKLMYMLLIFVGVWLVNHEKEKKV
jgi:hypothetical protein